MKSHEIGRMTLGSIILIEYDSGDRSTYFIQSGVAGFFATKEELDDLYGLLNYYYNIDAIHNTVVSLKDGANEMVKEMFGENDELAI